MATITTAGEAFVHLVVGLLSQVPHALACIVFVLNHLPRSKVGNSTWFYVLYALGIVSAVIVAIGRAVLFIAAFEAGLTSPIWIATMSFMLLHIVALSLWPISIYRMMMRSNATTSFMMPVNSERAVIFVGASLAFLVTEWALAAYLTSWHEALVVSGIFYLYLPSVVVVLATFLTLVAYQWPQLLKGGSGSRVY